MNTDKNNKKINRGRLGINFDKDLWKRFKQDVHNRHGFTHSIMTEEAEEAIDIYMKIKNGEIKIVENKPTNTKNPVHAQDIDIVKPVFKDDPQSLYEDQTRTSKVERSNQILTTLKMNYPQKYTLADYKKEMVKYGVGTTRTAISDNDILIKQGKIREIHVRSNDVEDTTVPDDNRTFKFVENDEYEKLLRPKQVKTIANSIIKEISKADTRETTDKEIEEHLINHKIFNRNDVYSYVMEYLNKGYIEPRIKNPAGVTVYNILSQKVENDMDF